MCADPTEAHLNLVGDNDTASTTNNSANRMWKLHKMTFAAVAISGHTHTLCSDGQITCKLLRNSLPAEWFGHHNSANSLRWRRQHLYRSIWFSGKSTQFRRHTVSSVGPTMSCTDWICPGMCPDTMPAQKKRKKNAISRWPRRLWWLTHSRPGTYNMNIIRFGIGAGQIEFVRRYFHQGSQMSVISAATIETERAKNEIAKFNQILSATCDLPNHNNNK